jgi:hypothetical protein
MTDAWTWMMRLSLGGYNGKYYLIVGLVDDSGVWTESSWYLIGDTGHYVEVDWRAASASGANDGGMTLWVDGEERVDLSGVDNDTRRIDRVRLGAVSGIDNGTRGTYYFDEFESRRASYIGRNQAEVISMDGFESGDFSAWSWSETDGGDLSVSADAALVGSNGLQAVIDDNNAIFLTDDLADQEAQYRARFYFDPNSIGMATGDAHTLMVGMQSPWTWVMRVSLGGYNGKYYLIAGLVDDSGVWTDSAWYLIGDTGHYVEVDWRAASGPGANDGGMTLWVDGEERVALSGVDNDTRRIGRARLGAVSSIDSGTRGTYYFDEFESRQTSYIGPVPGDVISADGFESGDFSAWSWSETDGGDLSVCAGGALVGGQGLCAMLDDNNTLYVQDDLADDEGRYRARFYFDPNSIGMGDGEAHTIFIGMASPYTWVMRVSLGGYNGNYYLIAGLVDDSGVWTDSAWYLIGDGPHAVEVDWRAASVSGANDGGMTLWVDEVQKVDLSGVDNDTRRVDRVRLGAVAGVDNGTRGTYYFDEFESRRGSYIGPVSASQLVAGLGDGGGVVIGNPDEVRVPGRGEDVGLPSGKEKARMERENRLGQERKVKSKDDVGLPSAKEKEKLDQKEKADRVKKPRPGQDVGLPSANESAADD